MNQLALIETPESVERPISDMSDRELLEEMAQNSREVRDAVTKALASFENSPLGQMLKGGQKINLMSLMKL